MQAGILGLRVYLLGHFEVWRDDQLVSPKVWGRRKSETLCKLLVSQRGRSFTRDQLIEALFPEHDPDKAFHNLTGRISELRRALEPNLARLKDSQFILNVDQGCYSFSKEAPCWVDVEEFETQLQTAQTAERAERWAEALAGYQGTVDLWRGDYLDEDRYEEWTLEPRERYRELYLQALSRLAECHARLGEYAKAIEVVTRAIEAHRTDESVYRQLMLYHYYAGDSQKALLIYDTCLQVLRDDLDAEPSVETQELRDLIVLGKIAPPVKAVPNNLPAPLTRFVGREEEVHQIREALYKTRLLTLTGVGGCGKTRLALKVATDLLDEFPGGVGWVELAPLSSPAFVPQAVVAALGIKEAAGRPVIETLSDHLRPKRALIILDNCEHLIEAVAHLASALLQSCPELEILATSRESLGLTGETSWLVPALSLPSGLLGLEQLMGFDAIRLFVERAQSIQPHFDLTEGNASVVTKICHRLDGLPLAIELATARLKTLSVEQIFRRLDDRFQLLTGGSRTALSRHQTLRACIDWSYELLAEPERALLRRLSVFAGGWTLQAAESICTAEDIAGPEVLDLLAGLVDKSLVVMDPQGEEVRYRLLETVRQYGLEKLTEEGEEESIRAKHLDFFLWLAEEAEPQLTGPKQKEWLQQLDVERANIQVTLEFAVSRPTAALRLAGALGRFWYVQGHWVEGCEALERALAQVRDGPQEWRAKALKWVGYLASKQGDYKKARGWLKDSLDAYRELGDRHGIANTLRTLGGVAGDQGDYVTARGLYEESLAIYRELGDRQGIAYVLQNVALMASEQGDYAAARGFSEEGLAIYRELADKQGIAYALNFLGWCRWCTANGASDHAAARDLFEESLDIARELGHQETMAYALGNLGAVATSQGDYDVARCFLEEGLAIREAIQYKRGLALSLEAFAQLASAQGQPERAAQLLGAAEALREATGSPLPPAARVMLDRLLATLREALGETAWDNARADGRAMTTEEAIEFALKDS